MAENSKGGIFTSAKKNLIRKKTQVLQSLGKTGKTTDEQLVEDCTRLEKQQDVATRFQKDLRNYIHSARALANASKQFYSTASETYEAEWDNHDQVTEILKNMDCLWEDYLQKLNDQIQEPVTKYLSYIPQIKSRIAKRGRKLIDYDNAKHHLEVHQNAKKKDEARITKAQEDLEQSKKIYEDLNNELHQELPEFFTSRLGFYGNLFQNLFNAEGVFYTEAGKGSQVIAAAGGKLATDNMEHAYTPRKSMRNTICVGSDENLVNGHGDSGPDSPQPDTPSPSSSPTSHEAPVAAKRSLIVSSSEESRPVENSTKTSPEVTNDVAGKVATDVVAEKTEEIKVEEHVEVETKTEAPQSRTEPEEASQAKADDSDDNKDDDKDDDKEEEVIKVNGVDLDDSDSSELALPDTAPPPVPASPPPVEEDSKKEAEKEPEPEPDSETTITLVNEVGNDHDEDEGLYQVPPPAKPVDDDYPPRYKHTVVATHDYKGEDEDELSFNVKEIIYVMEYDNPEEQQKLSEKKTKTEQDPGWLMGMKKTTREVGVFPENFTESVSKPAKG